MRKSHWLRVLISDMEKPLLQWSFNQLQVSFLSLRSNLPLLKTYAGFRAIVWEIWEGEDCDPFWSNYGSMGGRALSVVFTWMFDDVDRAGKILDKSTTTNCP